MACLHGAIVAAIGRTSAYTMRSIAAIGRTTHRRDLSLRPVAPTDRLDDRTV